MFRYTLRDASYSVLLRCVVMLAMKRCPVPLLAPSLSVVTCYAVILLVLICYFVQKTFSMCSWSKRNTSGSLGILHIGSIPLPFRIISFFHLYFFNSIRARTNFSYFFYKITN